MNDEEMAKNYAIGRTYPNFETNGIFVRKRITNFVLREAERAFLAGLNVYKPNWHKVADGDLPKEKKEYWCKVFYYESEGVIMFEKEAEERTKQYVNEYEEKYNCENTKTETDNYNAGLEQGYEDGFKDGAEFGYNKANEWHYVKDGDLPNTKFGRVDITVAYINAYENPCKMDCCFDGANFIYWDARKPVGWKKVDIFGKIYAWKYPEKLPEIPNDIECLGLNEEDK